MKSSRKSSSEDHSNANGFKINNCDCCNNIIPNFPQFVPILKNPDPFFTRPDPRGTPVGPEFLEFQQEFDSANATAVRVTEPAGVHHLGRGHIIDLELTIII